MRYRIEYADGRCCNFANSRKDLLDWLKLLKDEQIVDIRKIYESGVEYGEWKTGLRNDGFQYAFISLGNKIGMAVGTALLAGLLGKYGYIANQTQNAIVLSIMKHAFTTIPGVLWIVTAVVLFFYRLNKKRYNEIVEELKNGRKS